MEHPQYGWCIAYIQPYISIACRIQPLETQQSSHVFMKPAGSNHLNGIISLNRVHFQLDPICTSNSPTFQEPQNGGPQSLVFPRIGELTIGAAQSSTPANNQLGGKGMGLNFKLRPLKRRTLLIPHSNHRPLFVSSCRARSHAPHVAIRQKHKPLPRDQLHVAACHAQRTGMRVNCEPGAEPDGLAR